MGYLRPVEDGVVLKLRVVPRASRSELCGLQGDALKIRLQAPPVDGKANRALVKFLAGMLGVPARNILLVAGETSRNKEVWVRGVEETRIRTLLSP